MMNFSGTLSAFLCVVLFVFGCNCFPGIDEQEDEFMNQGRYTHNLSHSLLVTPRKVAPDGRWLSHSLEHHHDLHGDQVHYKVPLGAGEEYHLELKPSRDFLGPALVVERRKRDIHTRRFVTSGRHCHYQGKVRGHDTSSVALSACDGLTGMFRTDDGEFWIEPSRNHVASDHHGHPHVIFRRSAAQSKGLHRKRKRKKRPSSNCGTKEPRRIETRLEWQKKPGKIIAQGRRKVRQRYHEYLTPSLKKAHFKQNVGFKRKHARPKRSISRPRHVEAMLVADSTMTEFHQDGDVETYLLTIMNMVNSIYQDPTIGNLINVAVVRIVILEDVEDSLNVTENAEVTLQNFCKWQKAANFKDDSHPHHHDVAILVTRKDICARNNAPCNTLGVAHVAGMCQPHKSCSVNEDNGITLAHTITHELGHNFGMYHDSEKTGCTRRAGTTMHVMTPSFEVDTVDVAWSRCSRRDITNFLDQGLGECLQDSPTQIDYKFPELPPGAMYNADHQCRLQFNTSLDVSVAVEVCSPLEEICTRLWCVVNDSCSTLLKPAAPGTHCGKHMWCQNQKCVPISDPPTPVDGGWGDWETWGHCSRSCGAGVSITHRHCDNPEPQHGGKFCVGERTRYKICNTNACEDDAPTFRAMQCSQQDNKTFHDKLYKWLPYFDKSEPCELYCTDSEDTLIVPWGESALDGTPCSVGTRDMCIAGICRKVGCDWVVDSNATSDRCGICNGNGDDCNTVSGVFNETVVDPTGNSEVAVIPAQARNIKIEELQRSRNYIGISDRAGKKFWLNGKRQITIAGEYQVAGATALYERDKDWEKIRIPGPIKEDIVVYMIHRSPVSNPGIMFEYSMSKYVPTKDKVYKWTLGDWTACSQTCGGGVQHRHPVCIEDGKRAPSEEEYCWGSGIRPVQMMRVCNVEPCSEHWWVGPWQLCPVTCKSTVDPHRKRSVMCVDGSEMALPDENCDGQDKPIEREPCDSLPQCSNLEDNAL